jgi:hypothetical protein
VFGAQAALACRRFPHVAAMNKDGQMRHIPMNTGQRPRGRNSIAKALKRTVPEISRTDPQAVSNFDLLGTAGW